MFNAKTTLYPIIAAASLVLAACQPAEGPLERAGKSVDKAAEKVGDSAEKAGDKIKDAVNDAKK
jgi:predicted small secreted protein